jgi:hypothetical protein
MPLLLIVNCIYNYHDFICLLIPVINGKRINLFFLNP